MAQVVLRLTLGTNAVGPFSIYTGSTSTTPILTQQTRDQLVAGVIVDLPATTGGTLYTLTFENNQPGCENQTVTKQIIVYGTTETISITVEYEPGSVVARYNAISNVAQPSNLAIAFTNLIGKTTGGYITFNPTINLLTGSNSGTTVLSATSENYDEIDRGNVIFSGFTFNGLPAGDIFTVSEDYTFSGTPSPTPTSTNTPTPTLTPSASVGITTTPTATATATPSVTPSSTTSGATPTATATITPTPTLTPTSSVTPSITPTNTPSVTPSVSVSNTPGVSATATPTVTATPTLTPTSSVTPSVTPSVTNTVTPSVSPSETPGATPTSTPTQTPTITPTSSVTPSLTPTNTPTVSVSDTPGASATPTPTVTDTPTSTPTQTPTSSVTPSVTPDVTPTSTPEATTTPTVTPSVTAEVTPTSTPTNTVTPSVTPDVTPTGTPEVTPTTTPSVTASPTVTPTVTPTETPTNTPSVTPSVSLSNTPTPSITVSVSPSGTPGVTPTSTPTVTPSVTPSNTVTPTVTATVTPSVTAEPTQTPTASVTPTVTPSSTPPTVYTIYLNVGEGAGADDSNGECQDVNIDVYTKDFDSVTRVNPGDLIYTDSGTSNLFAGGNLWYDAGDSAGQSGTVKLRINESGEIIEIADCPAPTPTPTATVTSTPAVTPTHTPTASVTPTPSVTPSISVTPTTSVTPSVTPSQASLPPAYLLIEPVSIAPTIGADMFNAGASFYGFTNGSGPTKVSDISDYMTFFNNNAGSGGVPSIISVAIPQTGGGVDSEGNPIVQYNFTTVQIPSGLVAEDAYYTWLIPDDSIGGTSSGRRQTRIDVSYGLGPNVFNTENMDPTVYSYGTVVNPGGSFISGSYRMYTTNTIGSGFYYDNTSTVIYFKGNTVA